jgi:hypothetical protein
MRWYVCTSVDADVWVILFVRGAAPVVVAVDQIVVGWVGLETGVACSHELSCWFCKRDGRGYFILVIQDVGDV